MLSRPMLNEWSDTDPNAEQPSRWPETLFIALVGLGALLILARLFF
jgi:hypothetical protein